MLGTTHKNLVRAMREPLRYLRKRSVVDPLAGFGLPLLVGFGVNDQRWRAASAAAYRVVPGAEIELLPGVGHTPMMDRQLAAELRGSRAQHPSRHAHSTQQRQGPGRST